MKKIRYQAHGTNNEKWRTIADKVLALSLFAQGAIPGLPIPDSHKVWAMFACGAIGVLFKFSTKLTTNEPETKNSD